MRTGIDQTLPDDVLDILYKTEPEFDVPVLDAHAQAFHIPDPLIPWGYISRKSEHTGTYHFYTDDYRFSALLSKPSQLVNTRCRAIVEVNLSIPPELPRALVISSIYYKRRFSVICQHSGIAIVADINVHPSHLEFAFLGIPRNWTAYATRATGEHLDWIDLQYAAAVDWSRGDAPSPTGLPSLLVYGGGAKARDYCADHPTWIWIDDIETQRYHAAKETHGRKQRQR